jgi:hypothetical protein
MTEAFIQTMFTWAEFYDTLPFLMGTDEATGVNYIKFEKEFLVLLDSEMKRPITRDEMRSFVNNVLPDMFMGEYNDQY